MTSDQAIIEKYSARYWNSQVLEATERHEKFVDFGKESIKLYRAQHELNDTQRKINVWWYCINTLLPAYYSSTPKAQVKLRKRAGGMVPELGSVVLERNVQYALDEYFNFDQVGYNAALQFLLTGRAILWARYEAEFEKEIVEIALMRSPDGQLVDQSGQVFDTQGALELSEDPTGLTIAKVEVERKYDEKAILDIVQFDDFLTSDARNESEIEWVARRAYLDREAAEKKFGKEVADSLNYSAYPSASNQDYKKNRSLYEGKAELWEIWCKTSKKVYWLQKNGDKSIVQTSDPLVEFEDFFPCSVINQCVDPDSVIPVSDYVHCKDQILQIERLTTRLSAIVQAIRTNAIYDATMGTQVEELLKGDLKFTPVMNWPNYKGRGGTAGGVEFLDVTPFINALQILGQARSDAMGQLFETLKVSDLLRGASDASKTATANRLESSWSSLGLIVRQNQFAAFISSALSKVGSIIAGQFDPAVIFEIADADNLMAPIVPDMPDADPAMMLDAVKTQIVELYHDNKKLCYRIQIASDSMVALDQAQEKQDGLEMISSVAQFFEQMKGMIDQYPPLAGFSMALLQNVIRRYKGGEELDGIFQKALGTVTQLAQAREEAAANQAPAVDPTLQIAEMEAQLEQSKQAITAQLEQSKQAMEAEFKGYELQLKEAVETQKLALAQQELEHKNNELQVEVMKINASAQSEATKHEITAENNRVKAMLDLQRLELERMATKLAETEKLMEERRLSSAQELERIRMSMDVMRVEPVKPTPQTPIVINNVIPKSARRVGRITSDELGNTSIDIDDVRDDVEG